MEYQDNTWRQTLRDMKPGETISVECASPKNAESKRTGVSTMARLEGGRFTCKVEGSVITVTRCNDLD